MQRSPLRAVEPDTPPRLEHLHTSRYKATAEVLDTQDAVVLDLGALRVLQWVRPGETAGDFQTGTTVALELNLGINPWDGTSWTNRSAELYGTDHRLSIERILLLQRGREGATEIAEASMDTVDSDGQDCLLECRVDD